MRFISYSPEGAFLKNETFYHSPDYCVIPEDAIYKMVKREQCFFTLECAKVIFDLLNDREALMNFGIMDEIIVNEMYTNLYIFFKKNEIFL